MLNKGVTCKLIVKASDITNIPQLKITDKESMIRIWIIVNGITKNWICMKQLPLIIVKHR